MCRIDLVVPSFADRPYFSTDPTSAQDPVQSSIEFAFRIENAAAVDQDDHCIWLNTLVPSQSRIICSDKSANSVFVYNLNGELMQTLKVPKPGNIDCRNNVKAGNGEELDIVVVNERDQSPSLHVFRVDREKGLLVEFEEKIPTGENYGGCLFCELGSGILYAITTSKLGIIEQFRLDFSDKNNVAVGRFAAADWLLRRCSIQRLDR